jgi:DNA-binding CsgD family transcriptional regulator
MARMTVGGRDLRTMMRIVDAPDDAGDGEPLPRSILAALSELVGADVVHFMRLDAERRELPLYQEYGGLAEVPDQDAAVGVFWSNYWGENFCSYPDRTGDLSSVTKVSDFSTMAALRRTELWSDYFRLFGVHREMMVCLPSPPRRTLRLLLVRGRGTDFSERDRGLLALLRPHLDACFRRWERDRRPVTLTPRQRELLALVAAGRTNGQIARHLGISEGTVRTHMENIFERLGVTSRAAAVVRAFPHGYAEIGAGEASPAGGRAGDAGPAVRAAPVSA